MSTEQTVAESSTERLNSRGSSPRSAYSSRNRRPERMIEMYWSAVQRLKKMPAPTVEATAEKARCTKRRKSSVSERSMPLPVITPPKHMAQMMSHTVLSMPAMPRVATSSSSCGEPVASDVGPKQLISTPLNPDRKSSDPTPAMRATSPGCAASIATQASTTATKSVMMAGSLRTISTPVASGTSSSHGVMRNVACSARA